MKKVLTRQWFLFFLCIGLSVHAWAQDVEVTGRVSDSKDGSGLPGVNVILAKKGKGTVTDANGAFRMAAEVGDELTFKFLGYATQTKKVTGPGSMEIVLEEEAKSLKEAVVIGYGTMAKKDLTGSISTISTRDFQKGVMATPEQLIAGKAPGVQITNNSGSPGAGSTIRIRGGASLNASNDPLIVLDGVPLDNGGIAGARNPLSLINPNDIETFTVLKDAAAASIYGSRASNGVIIITTKKGAKGQKDQISFTSQNSLSVINRQVEVLSADQFRDVVMQNGSDAQKALLGKGNTNWQNQIFQLARSTDNNLSYSTSLGGNLPLRVSLGGFYSEGILKTDKMERQNLSLNFNPSLFDGALKVNLSQKLSRSSHNFPNEGAIGSAISFDPTQPTWQESPSGRFGNYFEWVDGLGNPNTQAGRNPLGLLMQRTNKSEVIRGITNVNLEYNLPFVPGLKATLNMGYDGAFGSGNVSVPDSAASDYLNKGERSRYKQEKRNLVGEFFLNYVKDLPALSSSVEVMGGTSFQDFREKNYFYRRLNFRGDTMANFKAPVFDFDIPQNRLMSFYGRVNYVFKGKWALTASLRQDGSSRFAPENRWGLFPGAAVSYRISDEKFFANQKVLTNLKFRFSWGVTGQQDIGANYSYQSYYSISGNTALYPLGGVFTNMARPGAYDPTRRWESTTTYNAGLDFGLWEDRITGSVDVFQKNTSDLLNEVPTAAGSNFGVSVITNIGTMENRGVELSLNTIPFRNEDWQIDLGANATFIQSKITKLNAAEDPDYPGILTGGISGGIGNTIQVHTVGFPQNSFFVYKQVLDEKGNPIEGLFYDLNNDGKITEADRYRYRQAAPLSFFGLSGNVTYKKFFLGFTMRANYGNYVYNNVFSNNGTLLSVLNQQESLSNSSVNYLETRFTGNSPLGNDDKRLLSDYFVTNASFLRMDNINIGYTFDNVFKTKANLTLNGTVQNAFVLTKYKGIDPELGSGIDNNFYPRPRIFVLGLTLSL